MLLLQFIAHSQCQHGFAGFKGLEFGAQQRAEWLAGKNLFAELEKLTHDRAPVLIRRMKAGGYSACGCGERTSALPIPRGSLAAVTSPLFLPLPLRHRMACMLP